MELNVGAQELQSLWILFKDSLSNFFQKVDFTM